MPVSAGGTTVDLANKMDEKPGSRNRNLQGVEYGLGSVGESAAGLNSRPASPAAGIYADTSLVARSEGEWIMPGVPTWVANVLTGCISKSTHLPPIPHEACEGWGAKLSNSS